MQTHQKIISILASIIVLFMSYSMLHTNYAYSHDLLKYRKMIIVNLTQGQLYAYQNGKQVFSAKIVSGRPGLPTPTGTFHVFAKLSPTTFYSPWPKSSPYWYMPAHINHALEFLRGGYFLHDSWWHTVYGHGTSGGEEDRKHSSQIAGQ